MMATSSLASFVYPDGTGPPRAVTIAGITMFILAGLIAALTLVLPEEAADTIGPLGVLLGYATAGTIIYKAALTLNGRERTAWRLIGLGFLSGATGVLAVGLVDTLFGPAPAFGPTDLFFLTAYALILGGLMTLPHVSGAATQRMRVTLDGLIGALSIAALAWVFFMQGIFEGLSQSAAWERWMGSAYPVFDVALIVAVMIVVMRRSIYRFDIRLILFGLGFSAQMMGDVTFLVTGVGKSFEEANPIYALYLVGIMALIVTGLLLYRTPTHREYPDRRTPWWAMAAPYGAAVALAVVVMSHLRDSTLSGSEVGLISATFLVAGLVIARQAVAIRENRRLVELERQALVASISHELRTPLTSVVGFLNIYLEEAEAQDDEPNELVSIAHHEAQYMARIVSDLTMLARDDPHSIELSDEPFDVRQQLNVAVRAAGLDADTVQVECDPMLGVVADRARLQQIVVNLLSNAERYGGPTRLVVARDQAGGLMLEVHDNGRGVPKKHEIVIWQRFERGAHRLNAAVPGSGIGLAIVDALARAYSGTVGYRRSERLGGACFWVDLPGRVTAHASYRAPDEAVDVEQLAPIESANGMPSRITEGKSSW